MAWFDTRGRPLSRATSMPLRIIRPSVNQGAYVHIIDGWTKAADALGWQTLLWDGRDPDRVFDSFEPDLYMADVRYRHKVPGRVAKGLTRVAMTVDQWADRTAYPVLARFGYVTKWDDVRWVRKLDPQLLYHHSSPSGIER